jgi:hypothetical protein
MTGMFDDRLAPVVEALICGLPPEEEAAALAAAVNAGEQQGVETQRARRAELRHAALQALIAEPEMQQLLREVEEWLDGTENAEVVLPFAVEHALPAARLDLATAAQEARLYIDAYPFVGKVVGDLDARCARWLAERLALVQATPAERLPAVRRSIATLAEATSADFPWTAASLRTAATAAGDERLWYEIALRITQRELAASER